MPSENLKIEYPSNLPVGARIPEIREAWSRSQVIVVCGETGSGKTTQLPKLALEMISGEGLPGMVGCTQPRRLAAAAMCGRVAAETGSPVGGAVGYQVRGENVTARGVTRLKFMTDGIPLAELRRDPLLKRYSALIVDEAHERTLNIDFLCGCLKNILSRRRDLRVAVSSATLDAEKFADFFGNAPIIRVEGRAHHIDDVFLPPEGDEELPEHVGRAVKFLGEYDSRGDILVFLPGEREIRAAAETLEGMNFQRTEIMPLYGRMSLGEQHRIFRRGPFRRIVLATNVAETSITIPGIDFVIDSNLVKLSRYNPRTGIQELANERVSRAAARQRRGRAGRLADGVCVHLCGEDELASAPEFTDCELRRSALAGVILEMAALELPPPEKFPFIDPPDPAGLREGRRTLRDLGALDGDGRLTADGRRIAASRLDPALGKMAFAAEKFRVLPEALPVVALLGMRPVRERPMDQRAQADAAWKRFADPESDFIGMLRCWRYLFPTGAVQSNTALRKKCQGIFLNYRRVREWRNQYLDLAEFFQVPADDFDPEKVVREDLHAAILSGVPRRFGVWDDEKKCYRGVGGRSFFIFPGSDLAVKKRRPPEWIFGFALVETSRLFARECGAVSARVVERAAPRFCVRSWSDPLFNEETGFVTAREKVSVFGFPVNPGGRVHYGRSHPAEARRIFIREALARGRARSRHPVVRGWLERLRELRCMEVKLRRPDSVVDEGELEELFDGILPEDVMSVKSLERFLDSGPLPADWPGKPGWRPAGASDFDPEAYPDEAVFGAASCRILYHFSGGPSDTADDDGGADEVPDGIRILLRECDRELFSAAAAEFVIPGYLGEKVEFLIRALPRNRRVPCSPLGETVAAFADEVKSRPALKLKGLAAALADFLCEWTGGSFEPGDFVHVRLPAYLVPTVEEINRDREVVRRFSVEVGGNVSGAVLSCRAPASGGLKTVSAGGKWPSGDWRREVIFQGVSAFPALFDGERRLFLDAGEAVERHADGVTEACMRELAGLLKMIRRDFRLSNDFKLGPGRLFREESWRDWCIAGAMRKVLGGAGAVWEIRSGDALEAASVRASVLWAAEVDRELAKLEEIGSRWSALRAVMRRLENRSPEAAEELEADLKWRFRENFRRDDAAWERLPAMLRMLEIRASRAADSPLKDREKSAPVRPWIQRRDKAAAGGFSTVYRREFGDFVRLLDEYCVSVFAPEVRTLCKVSPARLEESWRAVRCAAV